MTDEIPDDVVERALSTYWDADWTGACMDETYKARTDAMRAALRVAVEWEREQCALAVEAMPPFAGSRTMRLMEEATIRDAAAAIRSRKD